MFKSIQETKIININDSFWEILTFIIRKILKKGQNLGFKETKTHIQTTLAVKLHTLREMKAKSIPYWTKHENLVDFGTIFDAEVSVGDYIDSNRYILLGPAESLYVDMSKIGLTVLSYLSPLGRAVWGQPNVDGQETTYNAPDGSATCRIHKI